jgi:hypothetical protein
MTRTTITRNLGALLLASLSACGGGPERAEGLAPGEVDPQNYQVQDNDSIGSDIKVLTMTAERTPTDTLRIHVPIANMTSDDMELCLQTVFRDRDGIAYNDETTRERFAIPRNSTKTYSQQSLQARAQKFTVRIWRWKE